jgi:hypothetical protein
MDYKKIGNNLGLKPRLFETKYKFRKRCIAKMCLRDKTREAVK